jgi:hypothetical protein
MKKDETTKRIEDLAEGLTDFYPFPDITDLQKLVNRLYMKLRLLGVPFKEVKEIIKHKLDSQGISQEELLYKPNKQANETTK